MKQNEFPAGWDEERIRQVLAHYEQQTEEEAVAEDEFKLPPGVNEQLQDLLDRQDEGTELTSAERAEAEGLVNLAEMLSLRRLRAQRTRE